MTNWRPNNEDQLELKSSKIRKLEKNLKTTRKLQSNLCSSSQNKNFDDNCKTLINNVD